jgi:hypothetical protein
MGTVMTVIRPGAPSGRIYARTEAGRLLGPAERDGKSFGAAVCERY